MAGLDLALPAAIALVPRAMAEALVSEDQAEGVQGLSRKEIPAMVGSMNDGAPLGGVTVLDFTQIELGPCATQVLGDFGADVIKIERPGAGDLAREHMRHASGESAIFWSLNRNKKSVAIDVRAPLGREAIYRLARKADVVVHNFRPGVMERLGFGARGLSSHQSAADLRLRQRVRPHRSLSRQGRPGRAGAGDERNRLAARRSRCAARALRDADRRLHRRDAARAGASCWRCSRASAPGAGRSCTCRCSTACSRCSCRKRRPG